MKPLGSAAELRVSVWNRQRGVKLDVASISRLAHEALAPCLELPGRHSPVLPSLPEVEISLVSDRTIARVHQQFMNIPGATDVITFEHGEIVVSAVTAARESSMRCEPVGREVLRYIVHGLLHLNGHEDAEPQEAAAMWKAQEAVVEKLWPL